MSWNASTINGYSLSASHCNIAMISHLMFDDENWSVGWPVVETGLWLTGRKALVEAA